MIEEGLRLQFPSLVKALISINSETAKDKDK